MRKFLYEHKIDSWLAKAIAGGPLNWTTLGRDEWRHFFTCWLADVASQPSRWLGVKRHQPISAYISNFCFAFVSLRVARFSDHLLDLKFKMARSQKQMQSLTSLLTFKPQVKILIKALINLRNCAFNRISSIFFIRFRGKVSWSVLWQHQACVLRLIIDNFFLVGAGVYLFWLL